MGKTTFVNKVVDDITRKPELKAEAAYYVSVGLLFTFFLFLFLFGCTQYQIKTLFLFVAAFLLSLCFLGYVVCQKAFYKIKRLYDLGKYKKRYFEYSKEIISKLRIKDGRDKLFERLRINVNLGHEVLNEKDILCLIACCIRDEYRDFIRIKQNTPLTSYLIMTVVFLVSWLTAFVLKDAFYSLSRIIDTNAGDTTESFFIYLITIINNWLCQLCKMSWGKSFCPVMVFLLSFVLVIAAKRYICKHLIFYSIPYTTLDRLNDLCERISASVNENTDPKGWSNGVVNVSLFKHRNKVYPVANIREIESELIEIIKTINEKAPQWARVQFIVVFDELDKVDPEVKGTSDLKKENEDVPEFKKAVSGFPEGITSRERRQNVLRLLANMKLFLSTAQAKFVFVSGRELYDASLADLSDREFAISSIFNGILNVNSFLSPERGQTDICSMAEQYVAQMLLPTNFLKEKIYENAPDDVALKEEIPSLRWYFEYLVKIHIKENDEKSKDTAAVLKDIEHTVLFLHYFSVYLSHVSNGSPKKIAMYFERYIKTASELLRPELWDDEIALGKPLDNDPLKRQCVLYFDGTNQKKINFIFHISAPIMSTIMNSASHYGDKLLVSASFMVDHIYKHHNGGFSWRNLEQMPEFFDVGKTPELRDFMNSIMEFLLQDHITNVLRGLYQFKFHKSISEEISYISKVSDEASAIFNFTLDESLSVKNHYIGLLNHYLQLASQNPAEKDVYSDVIGRIYASMADLYFMDEEYYYAIINYRNALNYLEQRSKSDAVSNFLEKIRYTLKLGLVYECRRNYDTAFVTYNKLVNALIHDRYVKEKELGVDVIERWTNDWRNKLPMLIDSSVRRRDDRSRNRNWRYRDQFCTGVWDDGTDAEGNNKQFDPAEYSLNFDELISGLSENLSPEKSNIILKLSFFEEVRLVYEAILAKLFVLEKMDLAGITQSSIDIAESEFRFLHRSVNINEKFIIAADFYRKMGEILYYKNSLTVISSQSGSFYVALYLWGYDMYADLDDYCFKAYRKNAKGAVLIKDCIKWFFGHVDINQVNWERLESGHDWGNLISVLNETLHLYFSADKIEEGLNISREVFFEIIEGYLQYENQKYSRRKVLYDKIHSCVLYSRRITQKGLRLPCYACRYYSVSLRILLDYIFLNEDGTRSEGEKNNHGVSRAFILLRNINRANIKSLRLNQMIIFASTVEGQGNVLLSCASYAGQSDGEDVISGITVRLLKELSIEDDVNYADVIDKYETIIKNEKITLTRVDKSLLYYWSAYRLYNISARHKEAVSCLGKIVQVLLGYVSLVDFKKEHAEDLIRKECGTIALIIEDYEGRGLLSQLFRRMVILVNSKYEHFSLAEIHQFKWLFHKDEHEYIDLLKSSVFPDLQAAYLSIIDIVSRAKNILVYFGQSDKKDYRSFIKGVYGHIAPYHRLEMTFFEEVMCNTYKARFNKLIFKDILSKNILKDDSDISKYRADYPIKYFESIFDYISNDNDNLGKLIFDAITPEKRFQLLVFLIHDSIVCMTNVLAILTPHSHITLFPNSFISEAYNDLWEWSRFYELLCDLYNYRLFKEKKDNDNMRSIIDRLYSSLKFVKAPSTKYRLKEAMEKCLPYIYDNGSLSGKYGHLKARIFMKLRHSVDDATIHQFISNYSAEMAMKYYKATKEIHTEGLAYKNMINDFYFLDDDLHNDTCQFNLACERYLLNSGYIEIKQVRLEDLYKSSEVYQVKNYLSPGEFYQSENDFKTRFEDSLYTNSEY